MKKENGDIWRIFDKYHTSKFDMSGHPIVHDVFHVLERTLVAKKIPRGLPPVPEENCLREHGARIPPSIASWLNLGS